MEHHGKALRSGGIASDPAPYAGDFAGRSIIFLDVDGVLNNSTTPDRICGMIGLDDRKIAILKELVLLWDADLILSSSWKDAWFRDEKALQDEFADTLDARLSSFGLTIRDKTEDQGRNRGEGILEWIRVHGPLLRYVILDDERFDFRECGISRHWVQTSWHGPRGGIGKHHVRYIRKHPAFYECKDQ